MQSLREKILMWRDVLRCYRVRPKRVAIGIRVIANEVMAAQAPKFSHPTKSNLEGHQNAEVVDSDDSCDRE